MAITTNRFFWQNGAAVPVPHRLVRGRITLLVLLVLLVTAVLAGIGIGAVPITPMQLVAMVLERLGISHGLAVEFGQRETAVFFTIRLPRVILGVLVGAGLGMSGAAIGLMTFIATDEQLRSITFWNLGSLGGATWRSMSIATPLMALPLLALPLLARPLNVLLLGEAEASHLGINVETTKRLTVLLVALAV